MIRNQNSARLIGSLLIAFIYFAGVCLPLRAQVGSKERTRSRSTSGNKNKASKKRTGVGRKRKPTTKVPGTRKIPQPPVTVVIPLTLSPISGPITGGNYVTINGPKFNSRPVVSFDGRETEVVDEGTGIKVLVPAGERLGPVPVIVSEAGRLPLKAEYSYERDFLQVTKVEPRAVPPQGDSEVTIHGQGFRAGAIVIIANKELLPSKILPGGKAMSVYIPGGSYSPGTTDVRVVNRPYPHTPVEAALPEVVILREGLTFIESKLFWVDPNRGPVSGGTQVRISGLHLTFRRPEDLRLGGKVPEKIEVSADGKTLYLTTPPGATGWADVVFYNPYGQKTTLSRGFLYEKPIDPSQQRRGFSPDKLKVELFDIKVEWAGGFSPDGAVWSFDVLVNGNSVIQLPGQLYRSGQPATDGVIKAAEFTVEEEEVRLRVIGIRGETWAEGETTVKKDILSDILNNPSVAGKMVEFPVTASNPRGGHFIFRLGIRKGN